MRPAPPPEDAGEHATGDDVSASLRQIIAVLQAERQALAVLDLGALTAASLGKKNLCDRLQPLEASVLDRECRALAETARQLNEVNRRIRNVLAANVASRLDALTSGTGLYRARSVRG